MASKLQSVVFRAPGIGGLNFEGEGVGRSPDSARIAQNVVYDEGGRLCSRKGFTQLTTTALTGTPTIESLHMLHTSQGKQLIFGAEVSSTNKIYYTATPFSTNTDATGALTPSGNNWQFINFNNSTIGAQGGEALIRKTHAGTTFATIVDAGAGHVPEGNCAHTAFGRVWAQYEAGTANQNIVQYCALLDHTNWSSAGGGGQVNILGTASGVAYGYDSLVAISSFDQFLIFFMRDSIVVYQGADDPNTMSIAKVIQGVGCIARDSVQNVGDDILFLSATGVRSFKLTVQSETNLELGDRSAKIRRTLVQAATAVNEDTIKSAYFPEDAMYLLVTGTTVWALDLHNLSAPTDETRWTRFIDMDWDSFAYDEGVLYIGRAGTVGSHTGYLDDEDTYNMQWMSNWADLDSTRIKLLKKMTAVVLTSQNQSITFLWSLDYGEASGSSIQTAQFSGDVAEYGEAEFGEDEWAGGVSLSNLTSSASRSGQVISFGFNITVNNTQVCIEQIGALLTLGREDR